MKLLKQPVIGGTLLNIMAGVAASALVPNGTWVSHGCLGGLASLVVAESWELVMHRKLSSRVAGFMLSAGFGVGALISVARKAGVSVVSILLRTATVPYWLLALLPVLALTIGLSMPHIRLLMSGKVASGVYFGVAWRWREKGSQVRELSANCPTCKEPIDVVQVQRYHTPDGLPIVSRHDEADLSCLLECDRPGCKQSYRIKGYDNLEDVKVAVVQLIQSGRK